MTTDDQKSGFLIYKLKEAETNMICDLLAVLSIDKQKKIQNILKSSNNAAMKADKENHKSCGDDIMDDIKDRLGWWKMQQRPRSGWML